MKTKNKMVVSKLSVVNATKLLFKGQHFEYEVIGQLSMDVTDMTIMLVIIDPNQLKRHRRKINLYNHGHVLSLCEELSNEMDFEANLIEDDLTKLTDSLEAHRDEEFSEKPLYADVTRTKNPKFKKHALLILKDTNILQQINSLLGSIGIIGEEKLRLHLFIIATTYKTKNPLHAIVQGSTGTGKSHLINSIASCLPTEDVLSLSRITSKSLFHYQSSQLKNKLLAIQDFDGLEGSAKYALRELQSAQHIISSSTKKDRFGNLVPTVKRIDANFASLTATTNPSIYADNLSRSILFGIDESEQQTERILDFQRNVFAEIDTNQNQEESKMILRSLIELLLPKQVVNSYAEKIILPMNVSSARRLHQQFSSLINQITFLRQLQRKTDEHGRLIGTKEDLIDAIDLFSDLLISKSDELDPSTRQFFERLKIYLKNNNSGKRFSTRELRQNFTYSRSQLFRYVEILKDNDFITIVGGTANKGFVYSLREKIDSEKNLAGLKSNLLDQVKKIETIFKNLKSTNG